MGARHWNGLASTRALSAPDQADQSRRLAARLADDCDAELTERARELVRAGRSLSSLAGSGGSDLGVPLKVAGEQVEELVRELVRFTAISRELHGEAAIEMQPPRRLSRGVVLGLGLAAALGVVIAGTAVAELGPSSTHAIGRVPQSGQARTSSAFSSPIALLASLPANIAFDGGTAANQSQVIQALQVSKFDWYLVPGTVTIHIRPSVVAGSTPGNIWISSDLLKSGSFSWGVVQHEFGHQVDFALLTDPARGILNSVLGGSAWCYAGFDAGYGAKEGLQHNQYGCERFADMVAWAYWPSADNSMSPQDLGDKLAAMPPARFRALLTLLLDPNFAAL